MMKLTRVVACALMVSTGIVTMSPAQSLRNAEPPAEFPPSSYKGKQYVDSSGCVYIRAGIDGNVTWVPRVDRARKQICGQQPTLVASAPQAAPAPKQAEQITLNTTTPAAKAPAPKPKPKPVKVVRSTPKPKPKPAPKTVKVAKATPAKTVVAAPKKTVAQHQSLSTTPACPGASPISSRYINSGARHPVRCGPQPLPTHVASAGVKATGHVQHRVIVPPAPIGPETRVIPHHVYPDRVAAANVQIPEGYRPVWTDGRLNPHRAEQSLNGIAQTRLYWTNTVPRRLIETKSGRDVTAKVPLVYPYVDIDTQSRDLGEVTLVRKDGQLMKRIVRHPKAKAKAKVRQPTVSTRSAPAASVATPKAPTAATGPARYVQVGAFSERGNAEALAQKLARSGFPARLGKATKGGKTLQIVLAGPYASKQAAQTALGQARKAGFSDAFLR